MKLSQSAQYAILAMCQLNDPGASADGKPVSCRQLAQLGDMPERYLLQVLRHLVKQDLLISTRGVEGGYQLARPAAEISLLEIVESADGPLSLQPVTLNAMADTAKQIINNALAEGLALRKRRFQEIKLSQLSCSGDQTITA